MTDKISFRLLVDFYMLELASSETPEFGRKPQEEQHQKVKTLLEELADTLAVTFHDYLYLACVGEARHAPDNTRRWYYADLPQLEGERDTAMAAGIDYNPKPTLEALIPLFNQLPWGSAYGGARWANICKSTLLYYELPAPVFVDHVVSLKHNGGCAFNKPEGLSLAGLERPTTRFLTQRWSLEDFLDWKAEHNILYDPPPYIPDYMLPEGERDIMQVTKRTYFALQSWYRVFHNKKVPKWIDRNGQIWPEKRTGIDYGTKVPTEVTDHKKEAIKAHAQSPKPQLIDPGTFVSQEDKLIFKEIELPEEVPSG